MRYDPALLSQIKDRIRLESLIAADCKLKKVGHHYITNCPFHLEKTASFHIYSDSYYCFGCKQSGDIFSYLQAKGYEFEQSVKLLALQAGVNLPVVNSKASQARVRLQQLVSAAAAYYHQTLLYSEGSLKLKADLLLQNRQVNSASIKCWQLGVAQGGTVLYQHLLSLGYSAKEQLSAGMISEDDQQHYYDRFRERLIFPLKNDSGEVVSLAGRQLGNDSRYAKYLNGSESTIFSKRSMLYGIDHLSSKRVDNLVLVEGYFDAIIAQQSGYPAVVAVMGTSLHEQQMQLALRYSNQVYLAFDGDKAGASASIKRACQLIDIIQNLKIPLLADPEQKLLSSLKQVQLLKLPLDQDPDQVILAGLWPDLLKTKVNIVDFCFEYAGQFDLKTVWGKEHLIELLAEPLRLIEEPLSFNHYWQKLRDLVQLSNTDLQIKLLYYWPQVPVPSLITIQAEQELLAIILQNPLLLSEASLQPTDFSQSSHQQLVSWLLAQDMVVLQANLQSGISYQKAPDLQLIAEIQLHTSQNKDWRTLLARQRLNLIDHLTTRYLTSCGLDKTIKTRNHLRAARNA